MKKIFFKYMMPNLKALPHICISAKLAISRTCFPSRENKAMALIT